VARGLAPVKLDARLARLEKLAAATLAAQTEQASRAAEHQDRREAAWEIMRETMTEQHARLVVEAYAAGAQYVQSPEYNTPAGRLLRRCLDAMSRLEYRHRPHTEIADEVVLAMPPGVAEIYLAEDALPLHDCEDCGFCVPVSPGRDGRSARRHFDTCPLCGGRVAWYAYNRCKAKAEDNRGDTIKP
jgi:hypothetical protein